MSEPALFIFQREGQHRLFYDSWAGVLVFRELVWGPEALENWATQSEEVEEWDDAVAGAVFVNLDDRQLLWHGSSGLLEIPAVARAHRALLEATWLDFHIERIDQIHELGKRLGLEPQAYDDDDAPYRCETVLIAAGLEHLESDDDEVDEDERPSELVKVDEDGEPIQAVGFDEWEHRAWLSVIDPRGNTSHWQLQEVPGDLLRQSSGAIEQLRLFESSDVPAEKCVMEGLWVNFEKHEMGMWGRKALEEWLELAQQSWPDFRVQWHGDDGYRRQCESTGSSGMPMTSDAAIAVLTPMILSTERFSLRAVFDALGQRLKGTAIQATGCLTIILCIPFLVIGWMRNDWRLAVTAVATVVALTVIAFKFMEYRMKRWFSFAEAPDSDGPPVAGPLDKDQRREEFDQILRRAGFGSLAEIEPLIERDGMGLEHFE